MLKRALAITEKHGRAVLHLKSWAGSVTSPASLTFPGLEREVRLLGLGPGEWLAVSDASGGPELRDRVVGQVGEQGIAAVDLSSAFKILRIEGPAARELLGKACGLDLHEGSFPAGRSTRTRFAQLSVIVDCIDPKPRFDLYVGRSFAAWLHLYLTDSALEFA